MKIKRSKVLITYIRDYFQNPRLWGSTKKKNTLGYQALKLIEIVYNYNEIFLLYYILQLNSKYPYYQYY